MWLIRFRMKNSGNESMDTEFKVVVAGLCLLVAFLVGGIWYTNSKYECIRSKTSECYTFYCDSNGICLPTYYECEECLEWQEKKLDK